MIDPRMALLLMAALALGGCEVTAGGGSGDGSGVFAGAFSSALVRSPNDDAAAAVTAAAIGGLIGNPIGAALDDTDRRLAYQAQIDALERGAPGAPVAWRNPDSGRHGNIVPGPIYDVKGAKCRGYSHTVTIDGQPETVRRTACRAADGSWNAVG